MQTLDIERELDDCLYGSYGTKFSSYYPICYSTFYRRQGYEKPHLHRWYLEDKFFKNYSNRKVRHYKKKILNGNMYRKIFDYRGLFIKEKNMINSFENENEFLSNFYPSLISDGTLVYPTVEHYFQASKTSSLTEYAAIAAAPSPGKAKRLGRKCSLRPDWEEIKDEVMYKALQKKFSIPELKEKLLNTGDEELEEGNWWHDNYWGNCHCIRCNNIQGKNTLGKMLMKLREELREK